MLPGTRRETTAGDLCAFAASLLGLLPTRELVVAVGRAEMAAAGNQVTDYGEQTLARLAPTLQAAVDRLGADSTCTLAIGHRLWLSCLCNLDSRQTAPLGSVRVIL